MSKAAEDQTVGDWVQQHLDEVCGWPALSTPERKCLVEACDRDVFSAGLCATHRLRARSRMLRERDGGGSK
ncbi:hypothetical protein [Isoptericola sediminis]|uniref:Uncharacterized protein n=1 Tax=Isoptericola sediminis TaxID=2733572 RepID=A0A849JXC5_9MICO|nr:hypothetical protein [Isoptericola sediminis]NNU27972.1 hypothetical protein [Isoptericola sediminis]